MPKMKTKSAVAKRFSLTANGKLKFKKSGLRHKLATKSSSNKRKLGLTSYVHASDANLVKKCLPYA